MKQFKSLFFVLLAGTCTGMFFYLRSLSPVRVYSDTGVDSNIFWALSSLPKFGVYVLAANVAILIIWIIYSFIYSRLSGQNFKQALQVDAYTYLPLCILAISLVQFNALLTYYFEGFLLLSQNAGYVLFFIVLIAVYHLKAENAKEICHPDTILHIPKSELHRIPTQTPTWKAKLFVFLISFLLYALVGFRIIDQLGPSGDEPHYLLITHSLLYDHDLDIKNNYTQQDYSAFFQGDLKPHVSVGKDGTRYPGHPLGLPFLLLPAYALKGYRGSVLFMNCLAAFLAVQLYLFTFSVTQHRWLSLLFWFIISFTTPLLIYSSQLYPEIPSALLLVIVLRIITSLVSQRDGQKKITLAQATVLGFAFALLPWFQQRMILPVVILLCFYLISLVKNFEGNRWSKQHIYSAVIPAVLLAFSGIAMAGFYFILYGNPMPNAPYTSVGIKVFSLDILLKQGLLGLLLDQEAGLLIYSPYYLFFIPGLFWLLWHRFKQAFWLILAILSIYIPCGGFTLQWRGAWSPVSRYMVVLIPFLLIPLCVCLQQITRTIYRYTFFFLAIISFGWSYLFLHTPFSSIMSRGGINNVFETYSGVVDLTRYFPLFTGSSLDNPVVTGMWLVLIAVFSVWVYRSISSAPASKPSFPPERRLMGKVKTVFAFYGLLLGIFLSFTCIAEHINKSDSAPHLNKSRQLRKLLSRFQYYALANNQITRFQAIEPEKLRFEYINKEKYGKVGLEGSHFIVTGPREPFPRGRYTAYFKILVADNATEDVIATLDVVANRGTQVFKQQSLRGVDFSTAGQYELVPLVFELDRDVADLETRVYFHNRVDLRVQKIYIEPDSAELCYRAGLSALREEKYAKAKTMFLRAASVSEQTDSLHQIGVIEQVFGNWEDSVKFFQQVITRDPEFADAYYRLGLAWKANKELEKACQYFEHATRLLPTHLDAWSALKETYQLLNLEEQAKSVEQTIQTIYHPQYPYAVNLGNQILFLGYTVQNPMPGTLHLEYYWTALAHIPEEYAFFVHFKNFGVKFQQDHAPQIRDASTGQSIVYPTSQWKIGELIHEKFEIAAPAGTFRMELGVWDPVQTKQRLPVISPSKSFLFWKDTVIELGSVTIR